MWVVHTDWLSQGIKIWMWRFVFVTAIDLDTVNVAKLQHVLKWYDLHDDGYFTKTCAAVWRSPHTCTDWPRHDLLNFPTLHMFSYGFECHFVIMGELQWWVQVHWWSCALCFSIDQPSIENAESFPGSNLRNEEVTPSFHSFLISWSNKEFH